MGLGSSLEAFATIASPTIQIYNLTLGTAAVAGVTQVAFNTTSGSQIVRLRVTNLSTTAHVALTVADRTSVSTGSPAQFAINSTVSGATGAGVATFGSNNLVCSAAGAVAVGDGIRVLPGTSLELNIAAGTKLWLVASAASTPCQVAAILQNG